MPLAIEQYALIGDTQTAGLVGDDGSIDWLCFPRFDGPACFAALLGDDGHGRWLIAPAAERPRVTRRYRPGTLILETEFETEDGAVRVVDFMSPRRREPDLEVRRTELPRASAGDLLSASCPAPLLVLSAGHGHLMHRTLDGPHRWLLRHCTSPMALVPPVHRHELDPREEIIALG